MKKSKQQPLKIVNKKGLFNYEILKKYVAGIKLLGEEAKALRTTGGNLVGSYVKFIGKDLYLIGFNIPKYKKSGNFDYNPKRNRKLLLNKNELVDIKVALGGKGQTVIPVQVFLKGPNFKVELGIAKNKGKQGKKQALKEKQQKRDVQRQIKEGYY